MTQVSEEHNLPSCSYFTIKLHRLEVTTWATNTSTLQQFPP